MSGLHEPGGHGHSLARVDDDLRRLMREYVETFASSPSVRTVAVVGNAPLPPDPARARRIDACDLVVRVNSFWLDGPHDPASHGTRVDVVVLNRLLRATPALFADYRRRAYFVTEGGHVAHRKLRRPPAYWPPDLAAWPIPNRAVVAELRRLIDPQGEESALVVPTTGTSAAYLARSLFPDAHLVLTGFSFLSAPRQTSWSHHRGGTVPVAAHHKIDKEGRLMRSWVDTGRAEVLDERGPR
jgi:hypothetical protein